MITRKLKWIRQTNKSQKKRKKRKLFELNVQNNKFDSFDSPNKTHTHTHKSIHILPLLSIRHPFVFQFGIQNPKQIFVFHYFCIYLKFSVVKFPVHKIALYF